MLDGLMAGGLASVSYVGVVGCLLGWLVACWLVAWLVGCYGMCCLLAWLVACCLVAWLVVDSSRVAWMDGWLVYCLNDWLQTWSDGWLDGWVWVLEGWLAGWLAGCVVGWWDGWLLGCLSHCGCRLDVWLVGGLSFVHSVGWLVLVRDGSMGLSGGREVAGR